MRYIGLDGEGKGRIPHLYTLLAAADETGEFESYIENPTEGLNSEECLSFLVSLSDHTKVVFAYAFNYDLTKILEDLPCKDVYELFRPELRAKSKGSFRPIFWKGFSINYNAGKFRVKRHGKSIVVWDIFKFFQSRFVKALDDWKVGSQEERQAIQSMKEKREGFEHETQESIRGYCLSECRKMGGLARKLTEAHYTVDLKLREYYGAGSTASLILKNLKIHTKKREPPSEMMGPVLTAFAGGRFENSVIGEIPDLEWNRDISSAYPYQLYRMPCLEHGYWKTTTREEEAAEAKIACVMWKLGISQVDYSWGPFPFRTNKGSILFPISGGSGWTWKEEFFQARSMYANVHFVMAHVFLSDCDCRPFADLPRFYRERCRIGKDGPGIVLKLGPNACYGKIAQSVGNPKFNCWIWAGMITSNTRAQLLHAIAAHDDMSDVCILATDGLYSRSCPTLALPDDTGTYDLEKPLGGWEKKRIPGGMFAARPGVNFPLDLENSKVEEVRGRGFGRKALYENADLIRWTWKTYGIEKKVQLPNISRFYGAKTSIWKVKDEYRRAPEYGTWYVYEPFLSFDPMPKRVRVRKDGTLVPHKLPDNVVSAPYKPELMINDVLKQFEEIQEEQPE